MRACAQKHLLKPSSPNRRLQLTEVGELSLHGVQSLGCLAIAPTPERRTIGQSGTTFNGSTDLRGTTLSTLALLEKLLAIHSMFLFSGGRDTQLHDLPVRPNQHSPRSPRWQKDSKFQPKKNKFALHFIRNQIHIKAKDGLENLKGLLKLESYC